MKILPTIVAEREFSGLLRDEGNYTRKIKELNKLLLEINEKTGIANTVKDAEKMQFQSESIMLEAKAFEQKVHAEDDKLKKAHKGKLDVLRKRESICKMGEDCLANKQKQLSSDLVGYAASSSSLSRRVDAFEVEHKKKLVKLDGDQKSLRELRDRMFEIHTSVYF